MGGKSIQEYIVQVLEPCSCSFWSITPAKGSCSSEGRNVVQATLSLKRCRMALMDNQVQHVEIYAVVQVGKDGFEEETLIS